MIGEMSNLPVSDATAMNLTRQTRAFMARSSVDHVTKNTKAGCSITNNSGRTFATIDPNSKLDGLTI